MLSDSGKSGYNSKQSELNSNREFELSSDFSFNVACIKSEWKFALF